MDWRSHFNHKMTMTSKVHLYFVVLSWSILQLLLSVYLRGFRAEWQYS